MEGDQVVPKAKVPLNRIRKITKRQLIEVIVDCLDSEVDHNTLCEIATKVLGQPVRPHFGSKSQSPTVFMILEETGDHASINP